MQFPRRIKVLSPDTPFFSVKRAAVPNNADSSKVASGMEVAYTVVFRPESMDDYSCDLVICTEREKFLVPIVAMGATAALDFPDSVDFGSMSIKMSAKQTILVRNVGNKAAIFSLRTHAPFAVMPAEGFLNQGETLQVQLMFTPSGKQVYHGELELQYDNGRCVYSSLMGVGQELDVGLSQGVVTLLPTYVTKMSQKTFKVVNNSDVPVSFSVKQHASSANEMEATGHQLRALRDSQAAMLSTSMRLGSPTSDAAHDSSHQSDHSEDEDEILANGTAVVSRQLKTARRDTVLDKHLFQNPNFAVVPAEGQVWPHSEMEVVVQFMPDYAREYEVTAYLDVQGRQDRLPVVFKAKGLVRRCSALHEKGNSWTLCSVFYCTS